MSELWIADITYIRLETEFVYLAVVLDAYSHRVIGWALDRTLEGDLAMAALQIALRHRSPREGLTHHSDRSVQYSSHDSTNLLKDHAVRISMSRKGNPCDSAFCESFMKTLNTRRSIARTIAIWPRPTLPPSGSRKDLQWQASPLGTGLPAPIEFEQALLISSTLSTPRVCA